MTGRRSLVLLAAVLLAAAVAVPGAGAKPKPKPKPAPPAYNCATLLPASLFSSLAGATYALTNMSTVKGQFSACVYGQEGVALTFAASGQYNGPTAFAAWVTTETQRSNQLAPSCTPNGPGEDVRDCQLTPVAGIGVQAYEMGHQLAALTTGGTYISVDSFDSALSYAAEEAIAKYLVSKVK